MASEAGSAAASPLLPPPEASTSPAKLDGFWSSFAKRAKAVLLEDGIPGPASEPAGSPPQGNPRKESPLKPEQEREEDGEAAKPRPGETAVLQKGLDAIASSLALLGDTIGSAIEDGLNLAKAAEFRTTNRKAATRSSVTRKSHEVIAALQQQRLSTMGLTGGEAGFSAETQLKASRDVAMAMASKAKVLFRELKTVKADLTFLRERCSQLEEENRRLRESAITGVRAEEDDLVRLQLETLLAEKARLAQENANYCRENQFLREVVEYHQLSLQDDLPLVDDNVVEDISDDDQPAAADESNFFTPLKEINHQLAPVS